MKRAHELTAGQPATVYIDAIKRIRDYPHSAQNNCQAREDELAILRNSGISRESLLTALEQRLDKADVNDAKFSYLRIATLCHALNSEEALTHEQLARILSILSRFNQIKQEMVAIDSNKELVAGYWNRTIYFIGEHYGRSGPDGQRQISTFFTESVQRWSSDVAEAFESVVAELYASPQTLDSLAHLLSRACAQTPVFMRAMVDNALHDPLRAIPKVYQKAIQELSIYEIADILVTTPGLCNASSHSSLVHFYYLLLHNPKSHGLIVHHAVTRLSEATYCNILQAIELFLQGTEPEQQENRSLLANCCKRLIGALKQRAEHCFHSLSEQECRLVALYNKPLPTT
jgi:hypothetical protein